MRRALTQVRVGVEGDQAVSLWLHDMRELGRCTCAQIPFRRSCACAQGTHQRLSSVVNERSVQQGYVLKNHSRHDHAIPKRPENVEWVLLLLPAAAAPVSANNYSWHTPVLQPPPVYLPTKASTHYKTGIKNNSSQRRRYYQRRHRRTTRQE